VVETRQTKSKETGGKQEPNKSPEPASNPAQDKQGIYVVQRHHARTLHWDLRLEKDGVLVSWAVPKEPPIAKGVRRLAVQVEDHPLGYATYEGTIAEGEYGAGTVEIWDRGTYQTERWTEKEIVVQIKGEHLSGRYCLVRFAKVEKGWLFFKCDS
jgi:DNA ligase D-like protein (predicted 3'-phosphoesterase)